MGLFHFKLSHTKLNQLIKFIRDTNEEKQVLTSTHSSFVANKLGLENLILLNVDKETSLRKETKLNNLTEDSKNYFQRLSGYDTLRLVLCKKAILVEGDSDELVVQKAYMVSNNGRLPIEDEIDVISVGTAFLRFLEIGENIEKPMCVVTDNDGDPDSIKKKYDKYLNGSAKPFIKICFDEAVDEGTLTTGHNHKPFNYNTLEPKLLKVNSLEKLNTILDKNFGNDDELLLYMRNNKTGCALKIFETEEEINFPDYILRAIQ